MNVSKLLNPQNLESIKSTAIEMIAHCKANKMFLVDAHNPERKSRVLPSLELLMIQRSFNPERYEVINGDVHALIQLKILVDKMFEMLDFNTIMMCSTIKQFSKGAEKRITRETVPYIESAFILGEIDREFINNVYNVLGKAVPKKYTTYDLDTTPECFKIYTDIQVQITDKTQDIKVNTIQHYKAMVERIEDSSTKTTDTMKEFFNVAKYKIRDITAIKMCIACKFDHERFLELIDKDVENMVITAANRIICHVNKDSDVLIKEVTIGNKGFDVWFKSEGRNYNARAIPVNGYFVRFHYRYIIS